MCMENFGIKLETTGRCLMIKTMWYLIMGEAIDNP
jgi:hypothetical protein